MEKSPVSYLRSPASGFPDDSRDPWPEADGIEPCEGDSWWESGSSWNLQGDVAWCLWVIFFRAPVLHGSVEGSPDSLCCPSVSPPTMFLLGLIHGKGAWADLILPSGNSRGKTTGAPVGSLCSVHTVWAGHVVVNQKVWPWCFPTVVLWSQAHYTCASPITGFFCMWLFWDWFGVLISLTECAFGLIDAVLFICSSQWTG